VRGLAEAAATPLGTVSRVLSFLDAEALVTRDASKQVVAVAWPSVLERWARDYSVRTTNAMRPCLEPGGLSALLAKLGRLGRCAVTGSLAGSTVAPARLAMLYVDDLDLAEQTLELVPTDAGANVWLLEPFDEVVFERTRPLRVEMAGGAVDLVAAAWSQVVVDLLTSPGRGPQEAQALVERLKRSEDDWRVDLRP
jgi:hypothetical protein